MLTQASLQSALLSLLCYDDESSPALCFKLTSDLFIGRIYKTIATATFEYIKTYSKPPKDQLDLLLEAELRRGEEGKLLRLVLDSLKEQYPTLQKEFILSQLNEFEETQRISIAAQTALDDLSRGDIEAAKESLSKANSGTPKTTDNEIWLSDAKGMFRFTERQEHEFISSGVQALDDVGARPERKTVSFIIAATGKGKSWFLVNAAKAAIQYHHPPLYITLEMSVEDVAKRFLQCMFGLTQSEAKRFRVPVFGEQGVVNYVDMERDSVINKRPEIMKKLQNAKSWPKMLIKGFPTGSLSIGGLEAYLEYLEKEKKFKPTVVLLDYAQLMKLDSTNLRIDIGRLWVALRGIADRRDFALISASQGNRESENARVVDRSHVSEDFSQAQTADLILTYSQTPAEKRLGLCRILVAKHRNAPDRMMILNSQSYQTGQFSVDSVFFSRDVAQEVERLSNVND